MKKEEDSSGCMYFFNDPIYKLKVRVMGHKYHLQTARRKKIIEDCLASLEWQLSKELH